MPGSGQATELQHFVTICGGRVARSVTALTIHDIVIGQKISGGYFLQ
jgi:hypothetical protein